MNFFNPRQEKPVQINLTSLIDILFLLIIFFVLSTEFKFQKGVQLQLPKSKTADVVSIPQLVINMQNEHEVIIAGKTILWIALDQTLEKNKYDVKKHVILNIDQKINHGKVIQLMDLLKQHGFKKIIFGTKK